MADCNMPIGPSIWSFYAGAGLERPTIVRATQCMLTANYFAAQGDWIPRLIFNM
jgi:hypothetical protein